MMEVVGGFVFGASMTTVLAWMEFGRQREMARIDRKLDAIIVTLELRR